MEASAAASASAASTSSSAAASPSAAASATTSAAAPATDAPGLLGLLEALDLLGGTVGGGPRLQRILGGLGLDDCPDVLANFFTFEDLTIYLVRLLGVNLYKPGASNTEGVHFISYV